MRTARFRKALVSRVTSQRRFLSCWIIPAAVLAVSCLPLRRPDLLDTEGLVRRALPASVTIIVVNDSGRSLAQGSGFVASTDGRVITGWHVLCQAVSVE